MTNMNIEEMTLEEKVNLLKELITSIDDVVVTGCYGSCSSINAERIYIAKEDGKFDGIVKDKTVIIDSDICSG